MAEIIALDAIEKLQQVKDSAGNSKQELFDVLSLIHAAFDLSDSGGNLADVNKVTDAASRLRSLLLIARDKTASAINHLDFV